MSATEDRTDKPGRLQGEASSPPEATPRRSKASGWERTKARKAEAQETRQRLLSEFGLSDPLAVEDEALVRVAVTAWGKPDSEPAQDRLLKAIRDLKALHPPKEEKKTPTTPLEIALAEAEGRVTTAPPRPPEPSTPTGPCSYPGRPGSPPCRESGSLVPEVGLILCSAHAPAVLGAPAPSKVVQPKDHQPQGNVLQRHGARPPTCSVPGCSHPATETLDGSPICSTCFSEIHGHGVDAHSAARVTFPMPNILEVSTLSPAEQQREAAEQQRKALGLSEPLTVLDSRGRFRLTKRLVEKDPDYVRGGIDPAIKGQVVYRDGKPAYIAGERGDSSGGSPSIVDHVSRLYPDGDLSP